MATEIKVGDRVAWQSKRADRNGNKRRIGEVRIFSHSGLLALIEPDNGKGLLQWVEIDRLTIAQEVSTDGYSTV